MSSSLRGLSESEADDASLTQLKALLKLNVKVASQLKDAGKVKLAELFQTPFRWSIRGSLSVFDEAVAKDEFNFLEFPKAVRTDDWIDEIGDLRAILEQLGAEYWP